MTMLLIAAHGRNHEIRVHQVIKEARFGLSANTIVSEHSGGCTLGRRGAADPPEIAVRMGM